MVRELAPQTRPTAEVKPLRSYGRRKAKPLSARKERLIADLLPKLKLDLKAPAPKCLQDLFPVLVREVWLEIGFGSGEHLLFQAGHHIDIGFIGCEPFVNGVASLLGAIETSRVKTIRVHDGDAREVLGWLPESGVSRLFILFPDPWPKKRHLKRRLISRRPSRTSLAYWRPAASLDLRATAAITQHMRLLPSAGAVTSLGSSNGHRTGACGPLIGLRPATSGRP
jgi:tRNA (guanine-N7-)-methyltransferase